MHARHTAAAFLASAFLITGSAFDQTAAAPNPLDAVADKMPFDIPYGTPISLDRAEAAIK